MLPFTIDEFLAVFARYNGAIWPAPLVGGSAAVLLAVPQDWLLLLSGLIAVPLLVLSRRHKHLPPATPVSTI